MPEVCEGLLSWADATLERAEVGSSAGDLQDAGEDEEDEEPKLRRRMSLEERLLRLHVREASKETRSAHVNPCRNLLDALLRSDPSLPRLLLSASPDGLFSLKSLHAPGEELVLLEGLSPRDPLLNYFESQELPPVLLDVLEPKLWLEGCVLAEVLRPHLQSKALLLRPSTQSMICDSNLLTNGWDPEEKTSLEGELALLLSGPLCLDPNPVVSLVARKSLLSRQKLCTVPLRRLGRKRRAGGREQPLLDFIQSQRLAKGGPSPQETLAKHQASVRSSLLLRTAGTPASPAPTSTDVSKRARTIQKRAEMNDMTPHVVEEYILETAERSMARVYHTRLTIYQRLANDEYLGELYVERDYRENDNKGSTCRFVLGTQPHALRYINQFTEIFTEEGRKSVKITHRVPNQPPRVTYTPGMRERLHERGPVKFNALPKTAQQQVTAGAAIVQPSTRIIQFNNNTNHNNNHTTTTPSILQTQLQRSNAVGKAVLSSTPTAAPPKVAVVSSLPPSDILPVFADENNASAQQAQQQKDMEISAIKQALMKEGAEFEANKSSSLKSTPFAQLPTRPVPQASLADKQPTQVNSNPKLVSKQLSLHKILNAQAVQQQQQIQISAGGGSKPRLPSYTQAQQIKSKLVVTPSSSAKLKTLGHDAPGLQALLANTPSADSPAASSTLLERLVSGQAIVTTAVSSSSAVATPLAVASSSDSTNDITLAALLAKPANAAAAVVSGGSTSQTTIYSTKMSPLLQQLQQPVRTAVRGGPHLVSSFNSSKSVPTSTMINLPVQEANGFGNPEQNNANNASSPNVVSLQNLLQSSGVVNTSSAGGSSGSSIPVQLSIQGLPSPVTLSVNLSDHHHGDNNIVAAASSSSSSPNVFVATHSSAGGGSAQKVSLPKIVTSGNQTVLFQSPGNIIQLPSGASQGNKPGSSGLKSSPLLQVRPGQPVFLQVPNSQNKNAGQIQIVRTQSLVRPASNPVVINSLKSPAISPQTTVGLLSPSSIPASPQQLNESNLVAIQLQQQQTQQLSSSPAEPNPNTTTQQLILAAAPQQKQSISQIKVRQQRKQTLKQVPREHI